MQSARTSVDDKEIAHFAKDSAGWWDADGPFRPLHRLNPARLGYIRAQACAHFRRDDQSLKPFEGLTFLDIGCGGGLVCEPLARLGGTVTGVDADAQAIDVARAHAYSSGLSVDYIAGAAEDMDNGGFDIVLALEIVEHVTEPADFIRSCASLCKPGGLVIVSTLNRTPRSFALGIVAAEYILGWVPRGTHDWKKFVRPSELSKLLRDAGLQPINVSGLVLNPLKNQFEISTSDLAVNYLITAEKPE